MTGSETVRPALRHVGIFASDPDAVARFYCDHLGLRETDRGTTMGHQVVFLSADPGQHHQLVIADGRAADQRSTVCQLSFEVPDLASLRALVDRLRLAGHAVHRVVDHGTSWSAYVDDPEQNTVELYVSTDWYVHQPSAEPLDLDQPDGEIDAATAARCHADPTFRPFSEWSAELASQLGSEASRR